MFDPWKDIDFHQLEIDMTIKRIEDIDTLIGIYGEYNQYSQYLIKQKVILKSWLDNQEAK